MSFEMQDPGEPLCINCGAPFDKHTRGPAGEDDVYYCPDTGLGFIEGSDSGEEIVSEGVMQGNHFLIAPQNDFKVVVISRMPGLDTQTKLKISNGLMALWKEIFAAPLEAAGVKDQRTAVIEFVTQMEVVDEEAEEMLRGDDEESTIPEDDE